MTGNVKWFDNRKGFGFITGDDGNDYFVHYSDISTDRRFKLLRRNAKVKFSLREADGKVYATNVEIIKKEEA